MADNLDNAQRLVGAAYQTSGEWATGPQVTVAATLALIEIAHILRAIDNKLGRWAG